MLLLLAVGFAVVNIIYPYRYKKIIQEQSDLYGIDSSLVCGIIWTESKFNKDAVSSANAAGLMQLIPDTARWCCEQLGIKYSKETMFDAETNIKLGVFYLDYLLNKFSEKDAVAAYNAGEGNVLNWIENNFTQIPFTETRYYVERVFSSKKIYRVFHFAR